MIILSKPYDDGGTDEDLKRLLFTDKQLAEYLSVSRRTVWRLHKSGKLPKPIRLGGCVRWRLRDIDKWIEGLE